MLHILRQRRGWLGAAVAGIAALAIGGNAVADVIFDSSPPVAGKQRLYRVMTVKHSGLNLNVPEASTQSGTQIIQWNGDSFMNGQWEILNAGGQYVTIRNRWSRQCLDSDSSGIPGSPVVQRPCNGTIHQQWFSSGGGGAFYTAFGNRFSNLDMAIEGSSTAMGARLIQAKHSVGAPNALFQTTNTMFQVVD